MRSDVDQAVRPSCEAYQDCCADDSLQVRRQLRIIAAIASHRLPLSATSPFTLHDGGQPSTTPDRIVSQALRIPAPVTEQVYITMWLRFSSNPRSQLFSAHMSVEY